MEKNKKEYLSPALFIFELDEIMETVPWSPTPDDPAAKENNITYDEWDLDSEENDSDPKESLWGD